MARDEADIIQSESGGNPWVGYGGADLRGRKLNQYGFPEWEGRMGPAGLSHAAGIYQFQPGTWAEGAKALGVSDFSPESQKRVYDWTRAKYGDTPWAASAGGGGRQREGYYEGATHVNVGGQEGSGAPNLAALQLLDSIVARRYPKDEAPQSGTSLLDTLVAQSVAKPQEQAKPEPSPQEIAPPAPPPPENLFEGQGRIEPASMAITQQPQPEIPRTPEGVPGTQDNPLIQPGEGNAPVGARSVPESEDRNRFWNENQIAPYSPPGVPDDRAREASSGKALLDTLIGQNQQPDHRVAAVDTALAEGAPVPSPGKNLLAQLLTQAGTVAMGSNPPVADPGNFDKLLTQTGTVPGRETDIQQAQRQQAAAEAPKQPLIAMEGAELTGRIPQMAEAVAPYLAGGAPPGSASAGMRLPGRGRVPPERIEPPPIGAPQPAATPPAAVPSPPVSAPPAPPAAPGPLPAPLPRSGAPPPAPPPVGGAPPVPPPPPGPRPSVLSKAVGGIKGVLQEATRDAQLKATPMAAGPEAAQAVAKDFADVERLARFRSSRYVDRLNKFSQADREHMWEVGDQASVAAQAHGVAAGQKIIDTLPAEQRAVMMEMEAHSADLWAQAQQAGIVNAKAERLPFYMTRGIVRLDTAGNASRPIGGGGGASDLNRTFRNAQARGTSRREHLTAAETEAAAKARFGQEAQIVRDVRTLPMALERFERAINTRNLINEIEAAGAAVGKNFTSTAGGPGFFTVPNPAFQKTTVRFTRDASGKIVPLRDNMGEIVFDKKPIYVSEEWRGPLTAVLQSGEERILYRAAMQMKAGVMSLVMNSPLIHNLVEWGRALPAMKGKAFTFKTYRDGRAVIADQPQMEQAIREGLVPIGHRGYLQDIEGIAESPTMQPGRSLTAKALGGLTDLVSPAAGQKVRAGIDAAGNFWHNTLLWDRVAELQAGLWKEIRADMVRRGLDEQTAGRVAAHMANRYAGALPQEAMSQAARKILNVALFSRSFTMGNLGVIKDLANGLPQDVRAQILRDAGSLMAKSAQNISRNKAIGMFAMDIALFYMTASIFQSGLEAAKDMMHKEGKDFWGTLSDVGDTAKKIGSGYYARALRLANEARESPWNVINPFHDLEVLSSTGENEPGKRDRILLGHVKDGTAIYGNVPIGRVGGDFAGWLTKPQETLHNKMGFVVRPIWNTLVNDRESVRIANPRTWGDTGKNVAGIVWEFARAEIPETQVKAALEAFGSNPRSREVALAQLISPMFGVTVSRGYPGGEIKGVAAEANRQYESHLRSILPQVRDLVHDNKIAEAAKMLQKAGMPNKQIGTTIGNMRTPSSMSRGAARNFNLRSTPEQKEQVRRYRGRTEQIVPVPPPQ